MNDGTLTIGQLAKRAGLNLSAIRYYEAKGLLPEAPRVSGQRRFTEETLARLRVIDVAKRAGFTLDDIRILLDASDAGEPAHESLRELALRKLPEVDELIARAERVRGWLATAARCSRRRPRLTALEGAARATSATPGTQRVNAVWLRGDRGPKRVRGEELRCALLIEDVELGDGEACAPQQLRRLARQMAAAEHTLLHRLEPVLQALDLLVRGESVFDEAQEAARLENATELGKRRLDVRDRAHRPGGERAVEAVVGERQRLAVEPRSLDRHGRRPQPLRGELPAEVCGLDRRNPADARRVEGHVVSRAESDLDDVALEPFANPRPQRGRALQAT